MAMHTPAPWNILATAIGTDGSAAMIGNPVRYNAIEDLSDDVVLAVAITKDDIGRANAHLIAAAPDLLALAHQYRNDLRYPPTADSITRRLAAIDAVIAKVTGE